jgi:hypothetical protein
LIERSPIGKNPDLADIRTRFPREEILERVNDPDAKARLGLELNFVYAQWSRFDQYYRRNLRRNKSNQNTQIIAAALVPICAVLPSLQGSLLPWFSSQLGNVLAAIFGGVATVFGIFSALYNAHDILVRSITTRDRLELELSFFAENVGNYSEGLDSEKIAAFAANIGAILANETAGFVSSESKKPEQPKDPEKPSDTGSGA